MCLGRQKKKEIVPQHSFTTNFGPPLGTSYMQVKKNGPNGRRTNTHKNTVERTEKRPQIIGFKSYFKNRFDQLFRYSTNENLYTEGKEYRSALTGKLYQGYYHIHPEKGAMEGRQHTEIAHSLLIPVSGSNTNDKINKVETQRNNRMGGGY